MNRMGRRTLREIRHGQILGQILVKTIFYCNVNGMSSKAITPLLCSKELTCMNHERGPATIFMCETVPFQKRRAHRKVVALLTYIWLILCGGDWDARCWILSSDQQVHETQVL